MCLLGLGGNVLDHLGAAAEILGQRQERLVFLVDVFLRGAVRAVVEAAGIKDIRTKCLRSNNPQNVVTATMEGLKSLRDAAQVAAVRGKAVEEL